MILSMASDSKDLALIRAEKAKEITSTRPLSQKHETFVNSFLATGSVGDASEAAGYKRSYGWQLRRMPEINAAIQEYLESDEWVMDRGERFRWWTSVTRGMVPGFDARARLKASELMAKAAGDFDDSVKVQINNLQQNGPQVDLSKLSVEQLEQFNKILSIATDED